MPVPLISCSAHASKLPSWLSTPHIDCEEQRKGCMYGTNRIFEQTPSPHIYLSLLKTNDVTFALAQCGVNEFLCNRRLQWKLPDPFPLLWNGVWPRETITRYAGDNFPTHLQILYMYTYTHTQIDVCIRTY